MFEGLGEDTGCLGVLLRHRVLEGLGEDIGYLRGWMKTQGVSRGWVKMVFEGMGENTGYLRGW